jgi:TonB family protein
MFTRAAIFIAATGLLCLTALAANASSATIASQAGNNAERVPLVPLSVPDHHYPFPSLVANEEGRSVVSITVAADGRVTEVKIISSSGSPRLDQAALQVAKSQWVFAPTAERQLPDPDTLTVNIDWTLPFDDFDLAVPAVGPGQVPLLLVSELRGGVAPPQAMQQPGITADDYPLESIRNNEQGTIGVRIFIKEDGVPGEVEVLVSSGYPRLDEAARTMILRRWRYRPATRNGVPIASWTPTNVVFQIEQPATPPKECRQRPVLVNERVPRASLFGWLTLRRQVFADEEGRVQSALLLTEKGWMRLGSGVQDLKQPIRFYPKPMIDGMPARCWYDADVTVRVR